MQSNQHIERALAWSNARMLNDRCSGFFFNDMGRAALRAVILGVVVMLAQVVPQRAEVLRQD